VKPFLSRIVVVLAEVAAVAAASGASPACRTAVPPSSPAEPIVLISIDTLRADHVGAYGYQKVPTPNIDALASDGIVFERAYSHVPLTLPAHTSILSGKLPFETNVRDNIGFTVRPGERLLPAILRERGFATAGVVSAYVLRKETGIAHGFDFFDSSLPMKAQGTSLGDVQRDGAETLQVAERWLDSRPSPRFFLFIHFYEPHTPYNPPARYGRYAPYDGEIAYADELVGRVLESLKRRQLYDRAAVILLSDHGEGLGDHVEKEHGLFIYDETMHVPLVVKLPGGAERGRRVATPVQHIDIVPTVLELAGIPAPDGLRGRSLATMMRGAPQAERGLYSESLYGRYHFGWSELVALTDARFRYIKAPHDELYDLERDRAERHNLAADRPQARVAMRRALDEMTATARVTAPAAVSADERERLQSLGYVGATVSGEAASGGQAIDPKDKVEVLEEYRRAAELAGDLKYGPAIDALRHIVAANPDMADVWQQLGNTLIRAGRLDEGVRAYERSAELTPRDISALVAAATVLYKLRRLDEATRDADAALGRAVGDQSRTRVTADEVLAKIALARHDSEAARRHAAAAEAADPSVAIRPYVEGLILYDEGRYADAVQQFRATEARMTDVTIQLTELHYYTGDALGHLERYAEAESEFQQEIRFFPQNGRARVALAVVYHAQGRDAQAAAALEELVRAVPTPEGYGLAAQAWTIFGDREHAAALRSEGRERFKDDPTLRLLTVAAGSPR
jgi:arylsulfatase A-like enzyme/predicted Zn-dependent protease